MQFKIFLPILIMVFITSCYSKNSQLDTNRTPSTLIVQWLEALQNKDAEKLLTMIQPGGSKNIESNIKLYLKTVLEINPNSGTDIKDILNLEGLAFFKSFLAWEDKMSPIQKFKYNITEVQVSTKTALGTVLVGDTIHKINLIKVNDIWYIKAENLLISNDKMNNKNTKKISK